MRKAAVNVWSTCGQRVLPVRRCLRRLQPLPPAGAEPGAVAKALARFADFTAYLADKKRAGALQRGLMMGALRAGRDAAAATRLPGGRAAELGRGVPTPRLLHHPCNHPLTN